MVLAGLGQDVSEQRIARLLQTRRFGTPISRIIRLSRWGYDVSLDSFSNKRLQFNLDSHTPVIVQLWPQMMTYWTFQPSGSHVAVAVGYDDVAIYLNDPAYPTAPKQLKWDAFLAAWAEFDETAAIIQNRS